MNSSTTVQVPKLSSPVGWDQVRATLAEWLLPNRTMSRRAWPVAVGLLYIAVVATLGGLRSDHVLIGLLGLLDIYNEKTRLFLRYFLPFILTGVVYDGMRYFYWQGIQGHIHVSEPYFRDLAWFGIGGLTPNEYFAVHTSAVLDVLCGFAYLVFVGEYLLSATYLFFAREFSMLKKFGWAFFTVNVMGFITYFIYPAAPPWYVSEYGLGPAVLHVAPSSAAAHRFDLIFGTHFFDQIYGRGVDVFGAYPSLHVAYPFIVACLTFALPELKRARVPALAFYGLMCLSAVYLQHHYVVDILLGTTFAASVVLALRLPWAESASRGFSRSGESLLATG